MATMESRKGTSVAETRRQLHCRRNSAPRPPPLTCSPTDEEATTIKVASAKNPAKSQSNGIIKLKKGVPKLSKPGAWKEASVLDGS
jgi:hypothetical protein